ncbi:GH36-type glycosyl hydrolase domain-containing protein [Gracilibacillus phocaeensis]|uniref:GH36-type glycosyl hydrolase domain-containing protein n=1 Tax=Gracilibacillus phocaeensis TaxID=2042304 RepID=UPI00102F8BD8|nr:cellobiose phosphorylase [Gracilibacillus phocaeensis]
MIQTESSMVHVAVNQLNFSFLNSGDIYEITNQSVLLNQLRGNPIDGSLNQLYLRIHKEDSMTFYPLLGIEANPSVSYGTNLVRWTGSVEGITYQVSFILTDENIWFWDVKLNGNGQEVDLIYGQDVGLADKGAVLNNEAYVSQYIDHHIFEEEESGYVVCSRQNQTQSTGHPYLQQGSLTKTVGFSTDGFQFFGKRYKETNQPEALSQANLANDVYQYEFAYVALQSEKVRLQEEAQFVFYGLFEEDHPEAVMKLAFQNRIWEVWNKYAKEDLSTSHQLPAVSKQADIGAPVQTIPMTTQEIEQRFPKRHQEEREDAQLLSFFTDTYEHVVLKEKELLVERPHGHMIMSGNNHRIKEDTMCTTSWMYGIFNAQLVIGNSSFNKLLSNARNPLNIQKISGQRIYVELDGEFCLLTLPSLFEMGFNYARWFYKTKEEMFIITNYTSVDHAEVVLTMETQSGRNYRYLVTNQLVMHANEGEVPYQVKQEENIVTITADRQAMNAEVYPQLNYRLQLNGTGYQWLDSTRLATHHSFQPETVQIYQLEPTNAWQLTIQGSLKGEQSSERAADWQTETERYRAYYQQIMNQFQLTTQAGMTEELNKMNATAWWYTHNMLVHFSSPHGLEQYSGAAWGTRDVCQGPFEYFMATQNFATVREIIKTVYQHQFHEDGNWPQWFMFDNYYTIQAGESHGDIIVWPLKVVGDYLAATEDFGLLEERVPYTCRDEGFQPTDKQATIWEHMEKQIQYIQDHFLHDTFLSSYGDGDWDDTLQPANAQLKQNMVSSWTVALTYQSFSKLATILREVYPKRAQQLEMLAQGVAGDFRKYMLTTQVIPGFLYLEEPDQPKPMLHPQDQSTSIDYRLLPMQRSMISELFSKEEVEAHYQLIKTYLSFPDGVRLMNRPAFYMGGISRHFKRAEQAANFGREIGLQYVHAHIRYVEAMAKLGKKEEVWNGLQVINPIQIQTQVPNAERRQSNSYFSSSDGAFHTRYEAQADFDQLRHGEKKVKGGWRIYSSGPGIYINQLISHCLGIRIEHRQLVIDPVLEERLNGLIFHFELYGKKIAFIYHLGAQENRIEINQQKIDHLSNVHNRYREGGFIIPEETLEAYLQEEENTIAIYHRVKCP